MAAQIKLVRRRDFSADISSLSLLGYEDGFQLPRRGWTQTVASGDAEVAEAITLYVEGSSHDDLATKLQSLDDKIREVGWYADGVERYGVWLRAQMSDETYARQALITGMRSEPAVSFYGSLVAPGNFVRGYNLALERTPWWEGTANSAYLVTSINCLGGMDDYGTIRGDVAARVALTYIFGASGGGGPLHEFWMGFRTDRFSTNAQSNFVPVWDLGEFGTGSNDTDTDIADATAYNDYRAECDFDAVETELKRVQIALQSVTANYQDQRGSYVVLLRAKVDAATTCHVRLKDGYLYTAAIRAQPRVKITSTDWLLHALGTVDIPPSCALLTSDFLRQYGFEIHASRTAGSGNLYMDCLVLIPCAEGALHVAGAAVLYFLGDTRPATIRVTADGKIGGWAHQDNLPRATLAVEASEYTLPVGAGSLILAGQHETEQVLDDYVNVEMHTYYAWRTLRGGDGAG